MALLMFLAFLTIPLIEIGVFIQVGGWIGLWPTLLLVVLTAVAGTALLRRQGFGVVGRARATMDRGELPVTELFDGVCLLFAGALLLTPGFVTDAAGALLLLPPVRHALLARLARRFAERARVHVHMQRGARGPGDVVEGEYEEVRDPADPADSPWRRDGEPPRRQPAEPRGTGAT